MVGVEPTAAEIARARERGRARRTPPCSSSTTPTSTRRTARCWTRCRPRRAALAVVLMRDPYDAEFLAPGVLGLTAYGWRRCQLDAVLARLLT